MRPERRVGRLVGAHQRLVEPRDLVERRHLVASEPGRLHALAVECHGDVPQPVPFVAQRRRCRLGDRRPGRGPVGRGPTAVHVRRSPPPRPPRNQHTVLMGSRLGPAGRHPRRQGSASIAALTRHTSIARCVSVPRGVAEGPAVDGGDRVDVTARRGDERLLGVAQCVDRHVPLDDLRHPFEQQAACDPGEAAAGERRGDELVTDAHEHVGAGALAQPARRVGEDRLLGATAMGVTEGDDVVGVGDGLQPGGRAVLVAGPRRDHDRRGRVPRPHRGDRRHDGRAPTHLPGAEWRRPAGDRDPQPAR